jgi:hypothetical protein
VNPNFRTAALIAAALGLLVSLYIALRSDDSAAPTVTATATEPPTTAAEPPATTIEPPATTAPAGPVRITIDAAGKIYRGSVAQGRQVVVTVRASVTDEVHLHGYDLMADVAPGKPGRIRFTASIPGQFELELEQRGKLIGVLEVRP